MSLIENPSIAAHEISNEGRTRALRSLREYVSGIDLIRAALFLTGYYVAVSLGERAYGSLSFPSPFWLPDSVLLCTLLLTSKKYWPTVGIAVFLLRFVVEVPQGTPLWFIPYSTTVDLLKGYFAAWALLRVLHNDVRLRTLREFIVFLGIAGGIAPAASSILAAAGRHLFAGSLLETAYQWLLGDALAQAIVTPALLYWCAAVRERTYPRLKELLLLCGLLMVVLFYAFRVSYAPYLPMLSYAPVPFIIWAALRLRPIGAATVISVVASASLLSAVEGTGLFSRGSVSQNVLSLQLFLLAVAIPLLSLSIIIDDRMRAEQTLRESEEKFHRVFRDAGVGMVIVSLDGRYLAANRAFCECMGYTEEELKQMSVQSITHPEDWQGFSRRLAEVCANASSFQRLEKRCLHKSGQIVHTESSTTLIRSANGEARFFVAEVLDITQRKQAEAALTTINRRLLEAQEKEAARIARELHDDINQRIALLTIEMEQIRNTENIPLADFRDQMNRLCEQATALSIDVQTISHQLHSSKLEYLGIVAAMQGHCKEFARQHNVQIDFIQGNAVPALANEVSLCLFRVLQEALRNAVKHSGVRHFTVQLCAAAQEVVVSVSDPGIGFDPQVAQNSSGLGLVSMRERVRLAGGTISIESMPSRGTKILARVPAVTAGSTMDAA